MYYFSYGSNMSSLRLSARVSSAQFFAVAKLNGHLLKYHKKSIDGSGKCDIYRTDNLDDFVFGIVYQIDPEELPNLHKCEGYPNGGYDLKIIDLPLDDGSSIEATTYYAKESAIDPELKPYTWYKEHVLFGTSEYELDEDYIAKFINIDAIEDPDRVRHDKEMSIYNNKE